MFMLLDGYLLVFRRLERFSSVLTVLFYS